MILGAQFYTLRNFCKTTEGLDESLKKVADMGYTAVQLSGVCEYDAEWVAERCREYGLKIVITHFNYDKILNDTDATIEFHKKMNCPYIGLGMAKGGMMDDSFDTFINEIPEVVEKISAAGLKFMYHNHNHEFAINPKTGNRFIDDLCAAYPADKLGITMDTYWVQAGGADPAQWIMKLKGRNNVVHFKDMNMYLYRDADGKAQRQNRIATIGEGNMNYDSIIEACLKADVEYGFVELDDCYGADPFECMKKSYDYLTSRYGLK